MRRSFSRFVKSQVETPSFTKSAIIEGQYKVLASHPVPEHIMRPDYVTSKNPIFGIYEGK